MQLIHYADGSVLTGTSIARALVDYAQVLASHGTADTVEIPTREADGSVGQATFLLGPASQIVAVGVQSEFDELRDDDLVGFLVAETARQRGGEVRPAEQDANSAPATLEWDE
jgi:hypothetical protein